MKKYSELSESQFEEWRENSSNWILGILYFNPKDKRLFPPKRFKSNGWTINFANPFSVLSLITLILVINLLFSFFFLISL